MLGPRPACELAGKYGKRVREPVPVLITCHSGKLARVGPKGTVLIRTLFTPARLSADGGCVRAGVSQAYCAEFVGYRAQAPDVVRAGRLLLASQLAAVWLPMRLLSGPCQAALKFLVQCRKATQNYAALIPVVKFDRGRTLVLRRLAAVRH